jgi:uncharacterized damage-inducible protein DinB
MAEEREETRAEEVARVRSYLASQAMRRTPQQLTEVLQEAHQQFLAATAAIDDQVFDVSPEEGAWAAADVLAHVYAVASMEEQAIRAIIERGETPGWEENGLAKREAAAKAMSREAVLAALNEKRAALIALARQADGQAHLDILWGHDEFGPMNWREWLLFARVHALDHTRQMQAIAEALTQKPQEGVRGGGSA